MFCSLNSNRNHKLLIIESYIDICLWCSIYNQRNRQPNWVTVFWKLTNCFCYYVIKSRDRPQRKYCYQSSKSTAYRPRNKIRHCNWALNARNMWSSLCSFDCFFFYQSTVYNEINHFPICMKTFKHVNISWPGCIV